METSRNHSSRTVHGTPSAIARGGRDRRIAQSHLELSDVFARDPRLLRQRFRAMAPAAPRSISDIALAPAELRAQALQANRGFEFHFELTTKPPLLAEPVLGATVELKEKHWIGVTLGRRGGPGEEPLGSPSREEPPTTTAITPSRRRGPRGPVG